MLEFDTIKGKMLEILTIVVILVHGINADNTTSGCTSSPLDFTFLRSDRDALYTPSYTFKMYQYPAVTHDVNGTTVHLTSNGQYIELPNHGLQCIQDLTACDDGFTLGVDIRFHSIFKQKTYLFTSGGDIVGKSGIALYLNYKFLVCSAKINKKIWTSQKELHVGLEEWHRYVVSWNPKSGFVVNLDDKEFMKSQMFLPNPNQPETNSLLIGKGFSSKPPTRTSLMDIINLFVWTASIDKLKSQGCSVHYQYNGTSNGEKIKDTAGIPHWTFPVALMSTAGVISIVASVCVFKKCFALARKKKEKDETKEQMGITDESLKTGRIGYNSGRILPVVD